MTKLQIYDGNQYSTNNTHVSLSSCHGYHNVPCTFSKYLWKLMNGLRSGDAIINNYEVAREPAKSQYLVVHCLWERVGFRYP